MWKNYFKVAWRSVMKYKGYPAIMVAGLASSMAVCLLIGLFIHHEARYDRSYPHLISFTGWWVI